ncbi:dienelactone hydrolase family protein [Roseomonas sp. GC11]|uniref:dienelactone hydrolase family protein n=1 Tax=Roseomonas sp. GC11 TaxID=2950546 RepID=UPI0021098E42|nr:dienelactone hydrolase family protein [Roseomonas sp. GC11]MCQ4160730.1 dienelactone hydrolase family protein [Roseomonas sp. GC11]
MSRFTRPLALALSLAGLLALPAQAQDNRSIAARVELHAIPSLTLSDANFLTGNAEAGKAVTVTGELRVAQGQGRLPVAVLMHGSGGIGPNIEMWARLLNAQGISTFAVDGFTGRGITSTSADQAQLGRLNFIIDLYRSLDILAKHPRVDPARIALIGFSRGGQAAFYASLARFHQLWNRSGAEFAAYIPFYPDCATRYIDDTRPVAKPIRLIHGEADDYNPLRTCAAQAERLKAAGVDITVTTYPGAHHGFDTPLSNAPVVATNSQTVRDCSIEERAPGQLINAETGAVFTYRDACVKLNPQVGGQPEGRAASQARVLEILAEVFKK